MKLSKKISIIIFVSVISICGGVFNWIIQFLLVGILFFVSTFFLIDNKSKKWVTILYLLSPFLIIYGGFELFVILTGDPDTQVYPIIFISIISTIFGLGFKLLFLNYSKKVVLTFASLYLVLLIGGGYIFMCNWLHCVWNKKHILQITQLSDILIWDFSGNEIKLDEIENNVIILDFWNLYCRECFHKFPDLEKIKKHYDNQDVVVYAVYIPWHSDDGEVSNLEDRLKWIKEQGFTFKVVKTDITTSNNIEIIEVPQLLVFDKNRRIALNSNMQFIEKKIIINNIYSVIDKLLIE